MITKTSIVTELVEKIEANEGLKAIQSAAPEWAPSDFATQMKTNVIMEFSRNPKLQQCMPMSIKSCMIECASLGLIPSTVTGHAYLIPYKDKCTLTIGYKGLITLLLRNENIQYIHPRIVRKNDKFQIIYGTEEKIEHIPNLENPGEITHFYAIIAYKNGQKQFEVMTKEEVDKRRAQSQSRNIWSKNYEAMGLKSVIRKLARYLPINSMYEKFLEIEEKEIKEPEKNSIDGNYSEINSEEYLEKTLEEELSD